MGGCSSKPETVDCEARAPCNRELNLLLSGLKAIDSSDVAPYKGSQHTLQSLFIKHHRDGEDALENGLTLQELLQDPKPPPNRTNNESAGTAEVESKALQHKGKPSSPVSVFTDLAQEDEGKCTQTEKVFNIGVSTSTTDEEGVALSVANDPALSETPDCKIHCIVSPPTKDLPDHEPTLSTSIPSDDVLHEFRAFQASGDSNSTKKSAIVDDIPLPVADEHASSESADCKIHSFVSPPTEDILPSHEPNSSTNPAAPILYDSKAMDMAAINVQALDAEAVSGRINRHDQEVEGCQRLDKLAAESKIESATYEHAMGGAVERKMQVVLEELGEPEKVVGAYKSEIIHEEATMEICEKQHVDYLVNSFDESKKGALEEIKDKAIEDENIEAVKAEKIGVKDRESINFEKAEVHNGEIIAHENGRMQYREEEDKTFVGMGIAAEHEKEDLQDECAKDGETRAQVEHPGVQDASDKEETKCVKEADALKDDEIEEMQGGLIETGFQDEQNLCVAGDKVNTNCGGSVNGRALPNSIPSHVDSKAAPCELATMENIDQAVSCEVKEELKSDQGLLTVEEEDTSKHNDLGLAEKLAFGAEKPADCGSVLKPGINHVVLEKLESEEKKPEVIRSLEVESSEVAASEDVGSMEELPVEHIEIHEHAQQTHDSLGIAEAGKKVEDPALELNSCKEKKEDEAWKVTRSLEVESFDVAAPQDVGSMEELFAEHDEIHEDKQQTHDSLGVAEAGKKVGDPALELNSCKDKKEDEALVTQELLESNAKDNLRTEPTIELEHEKINTVYNKGKQEETTEVVHNVESDTNQASVNVESIYTMQIDKFGNGLDLNTRDEEADASLQMKERASLPK